MKSKLVKLSMMMCFVQGTNAGSAAAAAATSAGQGIIVDKSATSAVAPGKRSFMQRSSKQKKTTRYSFVLGCCSGFQLSSSERHSVEEVHGMMMSIGNARDIQKTKKGDRNMYVKWVVRRTGSTERKKGRKWKRPCSTETS